MVTPVSQKRKRGKKISTPGKPISIPGQTSSNDGIFQKNHADDLKKSKRIKEKRNSDDLTTNNNKNDDSGKSNDNVSTKKTKQVDNSHETASRKRKRGKKISIPGQTASDGAILQKNVDDPVEVVSSEKNKKATTTSIVRQDDNESNQPTKRKLEADVDMFCKHADLSKITLRYVINQLQEMHNVKLSKSSQKVVKAHVLNFVAQRAGKKNNNNNNANDNKLSESQMSLERWMEFYDIVKKFLLKNGHLRIPKSHHSLKQWVKLQNTYYRECRSASEGQRTLSESNTLTEKQLTLLENIGFAWNPRVKSTYALKWIKSYEQLEKYFAENGNADVHTVGNYTNKPLHGWVLKQKQKRKQGNLTKHQIKLLEKLNFRWDDRCNKRKNIIVADDLETSIKNFK